MTPDEVRDFLRQVAEHVAGRVGARSADVQAIRAVRADVAAAHDAFATAYREWATVTSVAGASPRDTVLAAILTRDRARQALIAMLPGAPAQQVPAANVVVEVPGPAGERVAIIVIPGRPQGCHTVQVVSLDLGPIANDAMSRPSAAWELYMVDGLLTRNLIDDPEHHHANEVVTAIVQSRP